MFFQRSGTKKRRIFMCIRHSLLVATAAAALSLCGIARADLTGTTKLDGEAPKPEEINMAGVADCAKLHPDAVYTEDVVADKGNLANVVVAIKKEDSPDLAAGEVPKEPATIDQNGCMYKPHVLAMMVGQEFHIKNTDGFL